MRSQAASPKNVLFIEANVDGTVGGSYFSLFFLAKGLDRANYRPTVLFASDNPLIPRLRELGIETHVMDRRPSPDHGKGVLKPFRRILNAVALRLRSVRDTFQCVSYLREHKIRILHLNNTINSCHPWKAAAILTRTPCIVHERGLNSAYSFMGRFLGTRVAAIICVSEAVRKHLLHHGIKRVPLITVHNGLDPEVFRVTRDPGAVRTELGLGSATRLVGMIGNIQRWKGQDVVIRAMFSLRDEFPNLVCILVGDVSPHSSADMKFHTELLELIQNLRLQDRVIITGYRSDVANYVNSLEVLIHASVEPEPFGRVLLEGMALRKPIVASDAGGAVEIVSNGVTGLIHQPGNSIDLAEKLQVLLRDDALRVSMGYAGYARLLDEFGIEKNVARTEAIYGATLSGTL